MVRRGLCWFRTTRATFPNEKQKRASRDTGYGRGGASATDDRGGRGNARGPKRQSPGARGALTTGPGVNCGGGDLVVPGDDSRARERGKDSRKHPRGCVGAELGAADRRVRDADARTKTRLGGEKRSKQTAKLIPVRLIGRMMY